MCKDNLTHTYLVIPINCINECIVKIERKCTRTTANVARDLNVVICGPQNVRWHVLLDAYTAMTLEQV